MTDRPARQPQGDPPKVKRRLDRAHAAAMKLAAESRYVFHDHGYTCKAISEMPEFRGICEQTISKWCLDGGWVEKRKAYLSRLRQKLEAHIAGSLVQQRKAQLHMYDKLRQQLLSYVLPDQNGHTQAQPKSTESVIGAILKLDDATAKTRKEIAESMGERVTDGQPQQQPQPSDLDPDMAQKLAHAYMAAQIQSETAQSLGPDTPPAQEHGPQGLPQDDRRADADPAEGGPSGSKTPV